MPYYISILRNEHYIFLTVLQEQLFLFHQLGTFLVMPVLQQHHHLLFGSKHFSPTVFSLKY